jgi:hypothetical protein
MIIIGAKAIHYLIELLSLPQLFYSSLIQDKFTSIKCAKIRPFQVQYNF